MSDHSTIAETCNLVFRTSEATPVIIQPGNRRFWLVDELTGYYMPNGRLSADTKLPIGYVRWNESHSQQAAAHTPPATAPHPSRSAPACTDCAHHVLIGGIKPACNHPSQPVYPVDGQSWVPPDVARRQVARCENEGLFFCGPSAVGFHHGNNGGDGHAQPLLFNAIEYPDLARALTAAHAGPP